MSSENATFFSLVWAGVATVIAALSSALTYIFKLRENENSKNIAKLESKVDEIQKKADSCEDDRATLFAECQVLKERVTTLSQKVGVMDVDGTKFSHRNDIGGKQ